MRNAIKKGILSSAMAMAVLAGAPTADADDCCRWELKVKRKAILSDNFEVELWAHFPDDKHAFAGAKLDILSNGVEWVKVGDPCMLGLGIGEVGDVVGDDVMDIVVGQIHFPAGSLFADTDNPIRVWCGEFEASGGAPFRSIWTQTDIFEYYEEADSSVKGSCDPSEAFRSVFVGPIVVDDWIAATFDGTRGVRRGDSLVLSTAPGAPPQPGVALTDETARWGPRSRFEHTIDVGGLPDGTTVDLEWFPWWNCGGFFRETLSARMVKTQAPGAPTIMEVTPDFGDVGVPRVPMRFLLDGREVGDPILGSGASFRLFNFCFELTWCYVLNSNDQLVLVLKCDNPFEVEVGSRRYTVDTIQLDPGLGSGQVGGLDRAEIHADGAQAMIIAGAGFTGGCRADCDGSGDLNIFDFLCFQNLFASGDLAADFDGDGRLTIFDFLEFQNAFATGCD
ncbi:MAG: GC-type dockerin domain-anchored protein [Phycisphaerales bacterium]|jgi:hypothetical protein